MTRVRDGTTVDPSVLPHGVEIVPMLPRLTPHHGHPLVSIPPSLFDPVVISAQECHPYIRWIPPQSVD